MYIDDQWNLSLSRFGDVSALTLKFGLESHGILPAPSTQHIRSPAELSTARLHDSVIVVKKRRRDLRGR